MLITRYQKVWLVAQHVFLKYKDSQSDSVRTGRIPISVCFPSLDIYLYAVFLFRQNCPLFVHSTIFSPSLFCTPFHSPPPPPFFSPSLILQPVYVSRSLLLPLPHCLLVLWCFNRWINDCFYFHSECLANTSCFAPQKEFQIGFGRQTEKKKTERDTCSAEGLAAYDTVSCQSAAEYICIFKRQLVHQET